MAKKKNLSVLNCIATGMIAYFFMVPLHELFHLITFYIYGDKCSVISAFHVSNLELIDYRALAPFHRIMVTGGSASILNAIIGIVIFVILLKVKMGPMVRVFLIQYMGFHLVEGFGYFLLGGIMRYGDWGNVLSYFDDAPGFVTALRIILAIIGAAGAVATFFILNYMSYYYIEDPSDKKQRRSVGAQLHLTTYFVGVIALVLSYTQNPSVKDGSISFATAFIASFMFLAFLWAFLFTGFIVKPPKESRFLYNLTEKPNFVLLFIGVALILVNTFVLGPGIRLN